MRLISDLPKDLFHSLLMLWLHSLSIGRLDSAICNVEQTQFLSLVSQPNFVLRNCYQPAENVGAEAGLDIYLKWLMRRGIATSQLPVTYSFTIDRNDRLCYLRCTGKHVHKVTVSKSTTTFNKTKRTIKDVCEHCPGIVSFKNNNCTWGGGYSSHTGLIDVIASHCHQLRYVYAGYGLSDGDWVALGGGCPHLTTVDWIASDVTDAGLLAIARNGALATLCLQTRFGLTDEGLRAAVSFCPHLQSVYFGCCGQNMDSTRSPSAIPVTVCVNWILAAQTQQMQDSGLSQRAARYWRGSLPLNVMLVPLLRPSPAVVPDYGSWRSRRSNYHQQRCRPWRSAVHSCRRWR
jgi:hypothetical protein